MEQQNVERSAAEAQQHTANEHTDDAGRLRVRQAQREARETETTINDDRRRASARAALQVQALFAGLGAENEFLALERSAGHLAQAFGRPAPSPPTASALLMFLTEFFVRDTALTTEVAAHFAAHFLSLQNASAPQTPPLSDARVAAHEIDEVLERRAAKGYQKYPQLGPTVKMPLAPSTFRALYPHLWVVGGENMVGEWKFELDNVCSVAMFATQDKRNDVVELRNAVAAWIVETCAMKFDNFEHIPAARFEIGFVHFKRLAYNVAMTMSKDVSSFRDVVNGALQSPKPFSWNDVFDKLPNRGRPPQRHSMKQTVTGGSVNSQVSFRPAFRGRGR